MIQFKTNNELIALFFTSEGLINICQKLVNYDSNCVGIIVWVNN